MTKLDLYNLCTSGGYTNTATNVSYKIINNIVFFQCSREIEDWTKNFNIAPVEVYIYNERCFVPKGFHEAVEEMKGFLSDKTIHGFVGYSHGAAIAALYSGITGIHAKVFGCPNFIYCPTLKAKSLFWNLEIYNNTYDIVGFVPPIYHKAGRVIKLKNKAKKPDDVSWLEWLSGHSPKMYRQNLEGV